MERFLAKVDVTPGCWEWTASKWKGYGSFRVSEGVRRTAHRWFYEQVVGLVPGGLDLDHLCRNRGCVNPDHLEPVTRAENLRRSPIVNTYWGSQTHCRQGHEYTPENTRTNETGRRWCRTCDRDKTRRLRAAKKPPSPSQIDPAH